MSDKTNVKVMAIEKLNRLIEKFDSEGATEEAGDEFLVSDVSRLDRAAARGSVRTRRGASISASRSRCHLRRGVSPSGFNTRDHRGSYRAPVALAESLCRTGYWFDT